MMNSHFDVLCFYNKVMEKTMPSVPTKTTHRVMIAIIMLGCFACVLYVYYNPTKNLFKYHESQGHIGNISAETCLGVLALENYRCTANSTSHKQPITTPAPKPITTAKTEEDTLLLIWMWPFGASFGLGSCSLAFNIHGCRLTDDRNLYNQSHGVMFHHRDISWDLSNMPQLPRPVLQKWIWWNMESPSNSAKIPLLNDLFNLTSGYRLDSDIPVPYGRLKSTMVGDKNDVIPKKDKLVCWIVSNYNSNYKRSHYYTELVNHIHVDAYGRHFNNRINDEEYSKVVSSCKFYLSFENSIHRDYFTEKLFNALALGTVPVVIGPPRTNYERSIPSDSFIHVDDYPSAKELADYLKHLDQNEDQYKQYFTWREHFVSKQTPFGFEHACQICDHLRRNKQYSVFKDLNSWYWD